MPTVTLVYGLVGKKVKLALSTTAQAITVTDTSPNKSVRVQIVCNSAWLYASEDEGATADNWLSVAAGQALAFDTGSNGFSFYAKATAGVPYLHFLQL